MVCTYFWIHDTVLRDRPALLQKYIPFVIGCAALLLVKRELCKDPLLEWQYIFDDLVIVFELYLVINKDEVISLKAISSS